MASILFLSEGLLPLVWNNRNIHVFFWHVLYDQMKIIYCIMATKIQNTPNEQFYYIFIVVCNRYLKGWQKSKINPSWTRLLYGVRAQYRECSYRIAVVLLLNWLIYCKNKLFFEHHLRLFFKLKYLTVCTIFLHKCRIRGADEIKFLRNADRFWFFILHLLYLIYVCLK